MHNFLMFCDQHLRKNLQQLQKLCSILHRAASQLSNDERVAENLLLLQEGTKVPIIFTQMIDPNGRVN